MSQYFLTAREVADRSGRSKSQVNRDAATGRIAAVQKLPGALGPRLFAETDVETYIEQFQTAEP